MSTPKMTARLGLLAPAVGGLSTTADASPAAATFQYGSQGWGVKCVQEAGNDWAWRTGRGWPLSVDGGFGARTRTWVKKFQYSSGISADDVLGRRTGNSLLDNLWRHDCYDYLPNS